jgi:hypothetical protein
MRGTAFARLRDNETLEKERHMIGKTEAIRTLIGAATIILPVILPAHSQSIGKRPGSGGYEGPPVEKKPVVDERAYKAALDRIPTPDRKYDPWGIVRPAEQARNTKKTDE